MSAAPALTHVPTLHGLAFERKDMPAGSEGDVDQRDVDKILAQQLEVKDALMRLEPRVQKALTDAAGALVESFGIAGNPGTSQKVAALREGQRANRREMAWSRRQARDYAKRVEATIKEVKTEVLAAVKATDDRFVTFAVDNAKRTLLERCAYLMLAVLGSLSALAFIGYVVIEVADKLGLVR